MSEDFRKAPLRKTPPHGGTYLLVQDGRMAPGTRGGGTPPVQRVRLWDAIQAWANSEPVFDGASAFPGEVVGDLYPGADGKYSLGKAGLAWKGGYFGALTSEDLAVELLRVVNGGPVRLYESAPGANYTELRAQAQALDVLYSLPAAQGAAGSLLRNDGAGVLSWVAAGTGDVSGPASSVLDNILVFADTTGKLAKDGGVGIAGLALAAHVQSAAAGGTGISTAASTGIPKVVAGTWSVDTPTGTNAPVRQRTPVIQDYLEFKAVAGGNGVILAPTTLPPAAGRTVYLPDADGTVMLTSAIGATVQAYNANLATIAGLTPTDDDVVQRKAGAWTNRSISQLAIDIGFVATSAGAGDAGKPIKLNTSGLLDESMLPALAISDVSVVASEVAMLALTAERGDIAIRSDLNKTFALAAAPASTLANWKELLTPTDAVLSVAGRTGNVTLAYTDISGLGSLAVLSTINGSNWSGADLAIADGGTGASDASTARTTLGLAIGTDVQSYDAGLQSFAALPTGADKLAYSTAANIWAETALSAAARTVLDDATVAAMVTTLGGAAARGTAGSGLVYGTSPSLTTPNIGAATGTTLQLSAATGGTTPLSARGGSGALLASPTTGTLLDLETTEGSYVYPAIVKLAGGGGIGGYTEYAAFSYAANLHLGGLRFDDYTQRITLGYFSAALALKNSLQFDYLNDELTFYNNAGSAICVLDASGFKDGFILRQSTATPTSPALIADGNCRFYLKSDKIVIQFNDGGTTRYRTMLLSGTGSAWNQSTTAP